MAPRYWSPGTHLHLTRGQHHCATTRLHWMVYLSHMRHPAHMGGKTRRFLDLATKTHHQKHQKTLDNHTYQEIMTYLLGYVRTLQRWIKLSCIPSIFTGVYYQTQLVSAIQFVRMSFVLYSVLSYVRTYARQVPTYLPGIERSAYSS
jgi:hypothetical protein